MAWFLFARLLFVGAIGYSAHQLHPLPGGPIVNTLFGVVLGLAIVGFEVRLKNGSVTTMLGALIGGAIGLGAAYTIGAALYWANLDNGRVVFLHSIILLTLPYLGLVIGGRKGDWLKPENIISLFRNAGPRKRYKVLDTSVIIDGRIADICETGFMDGTLVIFSNGRFEEILHFRVITPDVPAGTTTTSQTIGSVTVNGGNISFSARFEDGFSGTISAAGVTYTKEASNVSVAFNYVRNN